MIPVLGPRESAIAAQMEASDPKVSAFVSASAGSGKTSVLIDRMLRLLLDGAEPGGICCLTYTKAAAAEMALRLEKKLGMWVTASDSELDAEFARLTIAPDAAMRRRARALFGRVLEVPGGMHIGTIHSFCQSLLRRFPLEAQISPYFELADEAEGNRVLAEVIEEVIGGGDEPIRRAVEALSVVTTLAALPKLIRDFSKDERIWGQMESLVPDEYRARLIAGAGLAETLLPGMDGAAFRLGIGRPLNDEAWRVLLRDVLAINAGKTSREHSEKALAFLVASPDERERNHDAWYECWFSTSGRRSFGQIIPKKLREVMPDLEARYIAEQDRIEAILDQIRALDGINLSTALFTLAQAVLREVKTRKAGAGRLDYDDLIQLTRRLLEDNAGWVRFKLDEAIDHLLLDEVQDTSEGQWAVARLLWDEFFAGLGARDRLRTVFAVGDQKQSIFSFQGANPEEFLRQRELLEHQVRRAGLAFASPMLNVSFRSAKPILALVDAVFREPPFARGVNDPSPAGWLVHRAEREFAAGQIDLWPLMHGDKNENGDQAHARSASECLAEALADFIRDAIAGDTMLESRGRALGPGDILILVRRRNDLVRQIARALKRRHVPVAGRDRIQLTDELAVRDLLAMADVLLLSDDDLACAEFLKSPLGGLTDDSLMALALDRKNSLFETLLDRSDERADWRTAREFITRLRARVDFVTPHALLGEALGPLGGRARLLARLGPDAAEPIDELLNQSLRHQALAPPSLQSFVHWVRNLNTEIKREADASRGFVRIMTVHGAKGLQAPFVILPDTNFKATKPQTIFRPAAAPPIFAPHKDAKGDYARKIESEQAEREHAETNRLLYVALTRAEDRLLICGAAGAKPELVPGCWYEAVRDALAALGADRRVFDRGEGEALHFHCPQQGPPKSDAARAMGAAAPMPPFLGAAPDWRPAPLPAEPALPRPLAPSRPRDIELGAPPPAQSPAAVPQGFIRGRLIHALLQHLPDIPAAQRPSALNHMVATTAGLSDSDAADIESRVLRLFDDPRLAPLFGPGSRAEVPIAGVVGDRVIEGVVDRLVVLPTQIIVADYKSNRARPAAVPLLYLRQMAAYRALLTRIYPDRAIECRLIWTEDGAVSVLDAAELTRQAPT